MSDDPIKTPEKPAASVTLDEAMAALARAIDAHQQTTIADALDLYLAKPDRPVGINPVSQYSDVLRAFRRAVQDNVSLIELLRDVATLANDIATRFTGISPLAVSRAFFANDPAALSAALTPKGAAAPITAGSDPIVTDPVTGQTCPWTQAYDNLVRRLGANIGGQARQKLAAMLTGLLPK